MCSKSNINHCVYCELIFKQRCWGHSVRKRIVIVALQFSVYLSSVCLYVYLSIWLSSIYLSDYLSINPSIHLSICVSLCVLMWVYVVVCVPWYVAVRGQLEGVCFLPPWQESSHQHKEVFCFVCFSFLTSSSSSAVIVGFPHTEWVDALLHSLQESQLKMHCRQKCKNWSYKNTENRKELHPIHRGKKKRKNP